MNTKIAGRLPADQELLDEKRAFRSRALQGMQALLDSHLTDKGETELQNALYELDRLNDEIDELADKGVKPQES